MADELISKHALLSAIDRYMKNAYDCPLGEVADFQRSTNDTKLIYTVEGLYEATEIIDDVPTVDAVEVVRCKDCKHMVTFVYCTQYGKYAVCEICKGVRHGPDDFCSFGERREENAAD